MEKFVLAFIQGLIEISGGVALSLALARVPLRWKIILPVGAVLVLIIFLIRSLPFTFGLHTVVTLLLAVLFIAKTTRVSPSIAFVSVFVSFTVLATIELTIHEIVFKITGLGYEIAASDSLVWSLIGLPQSVIMILLALLVSKLRVSDKGAWKI